MEKVIEGFDNYTINDRGIIKRKTKSGYKEKACIIKRNKATVTIMQNNKSKEICVKNLTFEYFVRKLGYKETVINIDGNPRNCSIENLKAITFKEYLSDSVIERCGFKVVKYDVDGNLIDSYRSYNICDKENNFTENTTMRLVKSKKIKNGYYFRRIENE